MYSLQESKTYVTFCQPTLMRARAKVASLELSLVNQAGGANLARKHEGQRVSGGVRDLTLSRYAVNMFKREGVQGFYKGLGPSLLKAAPAAGVTLTAFEVVRIAMDSGAETASRVY